MESELIKRREFKVVNQDIIGLLLEELSEIQEKTISAKHLDEAVIKRGLYTVGQVRDVALFRPKNFIHDYNSIMSIVSTIYCMPQAVSASLADDSPDTFEESAKELAKELEESIFKHIVQDIIEPIIVRYIRFFIDFCLSQTLISGNDRKLITRVLDIVIEKRMSLTSDF